MGDSGNKKPKKDKSEKHGKHIASYQRVDESSKVDSDDLKKKK
jgi:hypothetical protein